MQLRLLPGIPFMMSQETFYRNVTRYLWLACNVRAHGLCQIGNGGVSIQASLSLTQALTEGFNDKQELLRTYTYMIYKFRSCVLIFTVLRRFFWKYLYMWYFTTNVHFLIFVSDILFFYIVFFYCQYTFWEMQKVYSLFWIIVDAYFI